MRFRGSDPRAQFSVALCVLLAALATVVVFGLKGLSDVDRANRVVFSDHFKSAVTVDQFSFDVARVHIVGLEIAGASTEATADQARARLDQVELPAVQSDLNALKAESRGATAKARIARVQADWTAFLPVTQTGVFAMGAPLTTPRSRAAASAHLQASLNPIIAFMKRQRPVEYAAAATAAAGAEHVFSRSRTWLIVAAALALLASLGLIRVGWTLKRLLEVEAEDRLHAESAREYTAALQATESEHEAHELLRLQVERTSPGSRAVVLGRNNSDDRLEPRTVVPEIDVLGDSLRDATPKSCLAIRFARSHVEGVDAAPLVSCKICGALPGVSTCEPLLVGGVVTGSVMVNHPREPGPRLIAHIRENVGRAAPVLANLRNLAIAELRAATDRLTGLPNQRAIQETFKRMVAQAARTVTPLAAVLLDVDHFKQINDVYGHDRGNDVLAAIGVALANVIRASDFVGRYGGEEFLILLPDTEQLGAVHVAEAARAAISAIHIAGVDANITASAGVAVLPADGSDAVTLFRAADRALYAAKKSGRNCVQTADDATDVGEVLTAGAHS